MPKRNTWNFFYPSSVLCLSLLCTTAQADTPFDIRVSYYDTAANAEARKSAIEANIQRFAEALYESTNGAHRLRNVTVFTDGLYKDNTDILWVNSCWPNAHVNSRGTAGTRIEHCDTFPNDGNPLNLLNDSASGGSVLMHEWAHFTYALLDEYQNSSQACGESPSAPCSSDVGVDRSIMHTQWNAATGSNWVDNQLAWLNFSTNINNNSNTNAQYRVYGASAWEVLAREKDADNAIPHIGGKPRTYYPDLTAAAPTAGIFPNIEIDKEAERAKAKQLLTIIWKNDLASAQGKSLQGKAIAPKLSLPIAKQLVIENSDNISANTLEKIKTAASSIIEQANIGDTLGLVVFNSSATVVVPPTKITDENSKTQIQNALQSIHSSNNPAALGDALQAANTSLKAANLSSNTVNAVYLFADGYSPEGSVPPLSQIDRYQKEDIPLFIFGTNKDTSAITLLKNLSSKTRGDFYLAEKQDVLIKAIQHTENKISPTVDTQLASESVSMTNNQAIPFYVDANTESIDIQIEYLGKMSPSHFAVNDAQGNSTAFKADQCVTEQATDAEQNINICTLSIENVTEGAWNFKLTNSDQATIPVYYSIDSDQKDNSNAINAIIYPSDPIVKVGNDVNVFASVEREFPIAKLTVTGLVEKPDGSTLPLIWHDDGVKPDNKANDGKYAASFTADSEGSYLASVNFDNLANLGQFSNLGTTYAAVIQPNSGPGNQTQLVNFKFTRSTSVDIVATTAIATNGQNLPDYDRVMNWGEAVAAPKLLSVKNKQILEIAPYKVRFYPSSNTYLGYNTADGNMYIKINNGDILLLGPLSRYLSSARIDGF